MSQNKTSWTRDGWLKHAYSLAPAATLAGGTSANAPTYEQVAGLRDDLLAGDLPKDFEDFSDIFEFVDPTDHNFFDSLGTGPAPTDVEFYHSYEQIESLRVKIKAGGALTALATSAMYFGDKATTPGAGAATVLLSSVIDITTEIGAKIRSGHILRNETRTGPELMLVMDLAAPTTGTGTLYLCRGFNAGGRISTDGTAANTTIPAAATQAHDENDYLVVSGLVTAENSLAPQSFRGGYTERFNLIQIVDFAISEGFLEQMFARKNARGPFKDPVGHARDIHELQFYEVWNNNVIHGVRGACNIAGNVFYSTGGILAEIKRYCTAKWSGAYAVGGERDHSTGTWGDFLANGDSNYRYGQAASPSTPQVFNETMLNDLNSKVMEKLGTSNKNQRFVPNTIWGPMKYRRIFGQFDSARFSETRTNVGATAGYYAKAYCTDCGNELQFKVDNTFGDRILIGNSVLGKKRPLMTMGLFTPPQQNRAKTQWFTSIMGLAWEYPEWAWGLHENLTTG